MNTPAPTPADLAARLLEHAAVHDAETSPYSPEQAQWAADLRSAAAMLQSPRAPADLMRAGAQLANVASNWAQRPGYTLTPDGAAMLNRLRREWDDAKATLSSLAPAQAAPVEPMAGDQLDPENCEHWCPHCGGSGDVEVPDGAGPDAHMVPANCPHCHGNGTLYAAYRGVVKLLQQEHQNYSKLLAEWYFLKNQIPAQAAPSAPLLQDADRALSKALAATPEAYRRPKAALSAVPEDRVRECAQRLVDAADFQLGGALSAQSKAKEIPSKAVSQVKARHLAALRDALAAAPKE